MHKVLLVDDQKLIRDGIRSLLALSGKVDVVAECADGSNVIATCQQYQPEVILLDLSMPVMNGVQTLAALQQAGIVTPVLILTTFDEHELVLKSISLGARGFLLKDVSLDTLVEAISTVADGGSWFAPNITERLLSSVRSINNDFTMPAQLEPLTDKELEILQLMAAGYSNKEIADELVISPSTVHSHRSNLMDKLGLNNRRELIQYARRRGLIQK